MLCDIGPCPEIWSNVYYLWGKNYFTKVSNTLEGRRVGALSLKFRWEPGPAEAAPSASCAQDFLLQQGQGPSEDRGRRWRASPSRVWAVTSSKVWSHLFSHSPASQPPTVGRLSSSFSFADLPVLGHSPDLGRTGRRGEEEEEQSCGTDAGSGCSTLTRSLTSGPEWAVGTVGTRGAQPDWEQHRGEQG